MFEIMLFYVIGFVREIVLLMLEFFFSGLVNFYVWYGDFILFLGSVWWLLCNRCNLYYLVRIFYLKRFKVIFKGVFCFYLYLELDLRGLRFLVVLIVNLNLIILIKIILIEWVLWGLRDLGWVFYLGSCWVWLV